MERVKPTAPAPALAWFGQLISRIHSKGRVHLEGTGALLVLHSLGPLGISETTVPPGGHAVLPKESTVCLPGLGLPLWGGLLSPFYR